MLVYLGVVKHLNVVVAIPLVTAVGKERIDGVVTGLGDHFSLRWFEASLLPGTVVNRGRDHVPPAIPINQVSPLSRGRGSEGEHDRTEGGKLVVELTSLGHAVRLKSQLKAAETHPKAHRVHVNMILLGCCLTAAIVPNCREILDEGAWCVGVLEDGDVYGNLLTTPFPYVL